MTLREELAEVEVQAELLKRRIAAATCAEAGCDMQFLGGRNCGCEFRAGDGYITSGGCSVPVHTCTRCGDSDYGENQEAEDIRAKCAEESRP